MSSHIDRITSNLFDQWRATDEAAEAADSLNRSEAEALAASVSLTSLDEAASKVELVLGECDFECRPPSKVELAMLLGWLR